jgi:hypothetical protein
MNAVSCPATRAVWRGLFAVFAARSVRAMRAIAHIAERLGLGVFK